MSNISSNGTPTVDNACPYAEPVYIVFSIVVPIITGIGIFSNTLCIAVFALILKAEKQNGHMFKYLLAKAVHDDVQFICQIFAPLYYCSTCSTYQTYSSQVWYIWFYYYVESINELCSGFLEVAATFDCLITINARMEFCKKNLYFVLVVVLTLVYSSLFYIFILFEFKIVEVPRHPANNTTSGQPDTYFIYEYTEFFYTDMGRGFRMAHGLTRDVLTLVLLVILNFLIFLTMKRFVRNKKRLASRVQESVLSTSDANQSVQRSSSKSSTVPKPSNLELVERNTLIMIILIGVNYVLGHITSLINYVILVNPSPLRSCIFGFGPILFYMSYATPFFIYFTFNRTFRSVSIKVATSCFRCLRKS